MALEPAPLLIGLREGLEALLVLGIVLGMLDRLGARDRRPVVWAGFGAGIVASVGLGLLIEWAFSTWFEDTGAAVFEVVVALAAVAVLTYMVLWMQRNARAMTAGLKQQVETAVAQRQVLVLAALGFLTVLREGLEVVLFYSALSQSVSWGDILLWGGLGFLASAALAYAVFAMTVKVDLRRFFAVSGVLLILIAAGLLMHVVHAATDLGLLAHGVPLWDTSGFLPDDGHWLGGPLHALIGYEDQPTLLQLLLYTTYLAGVGGWYLANLRPEPRRARAQVAAVAVFVLLLFGFAVVAAVPGGPGDGEALDALDGHGHDGTGALGAPDHDFTAEAARLLDASDLTVGLLVRSHGEPVHYNASTYESFKQFIRGIWPYTGLPEQLLTVDDGTYLVDDAHPFDGVRTDAELVDAWLTPWDLPAVPADDSDADGLISAFAGGTVHKVPGAGPGLGEPDVFELVGIGAYRTWLKMDNDSPMVAQNAEHFDWFTKHLRNHFGDRVVVEYAHHIDPKLGDQYNLQAAADRLVAADVDLVLDSYHSSVTSDAMNTCMMGPNAENALRAAGYDGPIVPVGMAGTHAAWGEAVADYLESEADHFEGDAPVAVYLAQHGGNPDSSNPCGPDGTPDQYHANAEAQFAVAQAAIQARFGDRFIVRQVYGQGAGDADDGKLSPLEALALDEEAGVGHAVIIPYEFWGDSMDNLVPLRESLGFEADTAPYYDAEYETHTTLDGVHVDVWSAHYGIEQKGTAHLARISEALVAALG